MKTPKATGKMSKEDFVLKGITTLRSGMSKGIHVVYSGFNAAFLKYFEEPARETVDKMVKTGAIATRPCKGGIMIYLPDEAPVAENRGVKALAAMGIK